MVVYVIAELFHEHFLRCQLNGKNTYCAENCKSICVLAIVYFFMVKINFSTKATQFSLSALITVESNEA